MRIELYNEDCLIGMQNIPAKSVDAIICDLPYGTTACKWDTVIPFEPLWAQYKRIIKDNGAIVLFGSQPFTSALVMSNVKWFKYEWIFQKDKHSNFALAKYQPLKFHENVLVFGNGRVNYYPQKVKGNKNHTIGKGERKNTELGYKTAYSSTENDGMKFPKSIISEKCERGLHPTQKPVALLEYLIKTYTNESDTVLDNTMGSGTTGVACVNTDRNFIGFELDKTYFEIAKNRIDEALLTKLDIL